MRESRDACSDVDGDASELVAHDFALTGMKAGSHVDPQRAHVMRNSACAADGADRSNAAARRGIDFTP
jgi:hypothetical protein